MPKLSGNKNYEVATDGVVGYKMEEHLKNCAYAERTCPKCGLKYLNWQED